MAESHERVRGMIAAAGGISPTEQAWLAEHLEACLPCREFAENSQEVIRALRGISVTAGTRLVSAAQMRVRQRAEELRGQRERMWVICACCAAVTLCSLVSSAALWPGVAWVAQHWMGQQPMNWQTGLSAPVWEMGLVLLSWMPAVVAGVLLLARGAYFTDSNDSFHK